MPGSLASLLVDLNLNSAQLRGDLDASKAKLGGFATSVSKAFEGVESMAKSVKRASTEIAGAGLGLAAVASGAVAIAAKVDKGVALEVKNLKNSFTDLAVPIAKMVVPAMRDLATAVRGVADWVTGLSPHTKSLIMTFIQVSATVGAAALVISKVAAAISGLAGIIAAITAGPFLAVIAGIAAIAAGALFLHRVWRENWGGIQEKVKSVVEAIAGYWSSLKDFLGGIWDGMIDGYGNVMKFALNGTVMLLEALGKVSKAQAEIQVWANTKAVDVAMNALKNGGVKLAALELGTTIKDGALRGIEALKSELRQVLDGFNLNNGGRAGRYGDDAPPAPSNGHGEMADMSMAMTDAADQFVAVGEYTERAAKVNNEFLDRGLKIAGQERIRVENDMLEDANSFGAKVREQLGKIGNALGQAGQSLLGKMGDIGQVVSAGVQGGMSGGPWGALIAIIGEFVGRLEVFTKFTDMLNGKLNKTLSQLNEAAKPVFEMLYKFSEALTPLREVIHAIVGVIFKVLAPIIGLIAQVLGALAPIFRSITSLLDGLGTALGGIIDIIVLTLQPTLNVLGGVFKIIGATINFAAITIMGTALGIVRFAEEIMKALGLSFSATKKTGDNIEKQLNDMIDKQKKFNLFVDDPVAIDAGTKRSPGLTEEFNDLGTSIGKVNDKFSELLTNIPSGYRTKRTQFGADDGGKSGSILSSLFDVTGGGSIGVGAADGGTSSIFGDLSSAINGALGYTPFNKDRSAVEDQPIQIQNLIVQSPTTSELVKDLQDAARLAKGQKVRNSTLP